MAISFISQSQQNSNGATATGASLTFNIGACDAVGFMVSLGGPTANPSFSVATWNSVNLNLVPSASIFDAGGQSGTVTWFALVAPATGSHTVAFTWGTAWTWLISFVSYLGVNQAGGTSSYGNGNSVSTSNTTASFAVTTAAGDATVGAWCDGQAISSTSPTADYNVTPSADFTRCGQHQLSSGSSDSYSSTMGATDQLNGAGFRFKAALATAKGGTLPLMGVG